MLYIGFAHTLAFNQGARGGITTDVSHEKQIPAQDIILVIVYIWECRVRRD